ncbi:MAG: hypothetical protein RL077_5834, partial [Verrucomicrobiota bacterium]
TVADPGIHRVGWRKEATGAEVRGAHGEEIDWGVVAAGAVITGEVEDGLVGTAGGEEVRAPPRAPWPPTHRIGRYCWRRGSALG